MCDREGDAGVEGRDDMEADLTCIELNRERGVDVGLYCGIGDVDGGVGVVAFERVSTGIPTEALSRLSSVHADW